MTFEHIKPKGCSQPVFKITKVMRSAQQHFDPFRGEHYHILKLFVVLPKSPMDYISSADVSGRNIAMGYGGEPIAERRRLPLIFRKPKDKIPILDEKFVILKEYCGDP